MNFQAMLFYGLQVSFYTHDITIGFLNEDYVLIVAGISSLFLGIVFFSFLMKTKYLSYLIRLLTIVFIVNRVYFYGSYQLWSSFLIVQIIFQTKQFSSVSTQLIILFSYFFVCGFDYQGRVKLTTTSDIFYCVNLIMYQLIKYILQGQNQLYAQNIFEEEIFKQNFFQLYDKSQKLIYQFPESKILHLESKEQTQFQIKIYNETQLSNSPLNQINKHKNKIFYNIPTFLDYMENIDNIDSMGFHYYVAILFDQKTKLKTKYKIIHHQIKQNQHLLMFTIIDQNILKNANYKFNKLIKEFGGIFTHKLKTPLNTVLGYLNQAYEDQNIDSSTQINYIKPAYINSKLELFQVLDVLEYFNSEGDTGALQICKINLKTLLYSLQELINQQCKMKNITLKFYINEVRFNKCENMYIYSDVQKLERTLFNLLHMSYRNTTQRGLITLNITFDKELEEAEFKVADQGSELSLMEIEEINSFMNDNNFFKPIKRQLKYSQEMIMAIKITNKLIFSLNNLSNQSLEINQSKHGGCEYKFKISTTKDRSVDSSTDQYRVGYILKQRSFKQLQTHHNISQKSIFCIQEPVYNIFDEHIDEPSANKPLVQQTVKRIKKKKQVQISEEIQNNNESYSPNILDKEKYILIVDDEPFNHDTLILMLKNIGFKKFLKAFNGQQAIQIAIEKQNEIQVVFMDLDMPIMGGIEATKILIDGMLNQTITYFPIIGCTAHDDQESHNQCMQAGMLHVVIKPVFIKTVKEAFAILQEDPYKKSIQRIGSMLLH